MRHGALSPSLVGEAAQQLLADLRATEAPWLSDVDAVLLDSWLYSLAAVLKLRAWLDDAGLLDASGKPRAAVDLWLRLERRLDRATQRLGFDPVARAGLARDSALARHLAGSDLAGVRDAGRRALEARQSDEGGAA